MLSSAQRGSALASDLSILICSWNTIDDLRACLRSLAEHGLEGIEVLVVDNNSADGSADMVAAEFPTVKLFREFVNHGFTGGNNLLMKHASGRHWLLLNSDTVVHTGALGTLLSLAESDPKIGIIGPRLLNTDGSLQWSCRRFPNPIAALFRNTFLGRLFPKNRYTRDYLMQDISHDEVREVDWVSGAALLITESARPKIGWLDADFFMFCEDMDLCWRAHQAGFRVVYEPSAVITHHIGQSTSKAPNRMIWRFHKSMHLFFKKHMAPRTLVVRQLALGLAWSVIALRASLFLGKNAIDRWRRRLGR